MSVSETDSEVSARLELEQTQRSEGWKLLRGLLRDQRRNLLIGGIIGITWASFKVAIPQVTKFAINNGIEKDGPLLGWAVTIACLGVVTGVLSGLRRYVAFRESRWAETLLREKLFSHVLGLDIGYHDKAQTGQLMSRASSDLMQIQAFIVMIPITLSNVIQIFAVATILFITDPVLAIVAMLPLPFVNISARRFSNRIHPISVAVQAEQAQLANVVEESVSGVRVVKGFGAEQVQFDKLEKEANDIFGEAMKAAKIRSNFLPAIDVLPALGAVGVLGVGGHRVLSGQLSIGDLVAFNVYLTLLVWPLRNIGMIVALGQRAAAALVRIQEVLSTSSEINDPAVAKTLPSAANLQLGAIKFDHVQFGYDPALVVLKNFNLEIAAGESIAIVGATGSGKSTVARLLLRFYDTNSGHVFLDGIDIRKLRLAELRQQIGVVFEDTILFNDTVTNNISFAKPNADHADLERAAKLAGAHDFILQLPNGYDTVIGERGFSLSGGQRQRIAIARAIISDPRVLVLDDATSAVDPSKEGEIRDAMRTVMSGRTTIVIAHRPGTIALAERVVFIDESSIAAIGKHDELVATNDRYREVLASMEQSKSQQTPVSAK
ncbi:multidrug efflux ATP-binding/permease protein BCG_0231 [Acidimicrobiaceae bacterium]|nr:multidrug efflux ATP-binding/permease protein BCG_0231 [Acidimicrobiaceae bacterium]